MAIIKAINSSAGIGGILDYIRDEEKTTPALIGGYNCNPQTAIEEMRDTKEMWRKTGGRQYKHFIQSFPANEIITPAEAHQIAGEWIAKNPLFQGYEVCYATHTDRGHVHTHAVVNSVSFETGKKFRYSKWHLQEMKDLSDKILEKHGKSICRKKDTITAFKIGAYRSIEKAVQGKYKSWLYDTVVAVRKAKKSAVSKDDFISKLHGAGYTVKWQDNRKYITFINSAGKKVRNKTLEDTFKISLSKEELLHEFGRNLATNRNAAGRIDQDSGRQNTKRHPHKGKRRAQGSAYEIRGRLSDVSNIGTDFDVRKQAAKLRADREKQRNAEQKDHKPAVEQPTVREMPDVRDTKVRGGDERSR